MQLAKNAQGVWISADRANKKELYFCPKCQGLVRLRSGEGVRPHFAHVIETKARGESQEHRAAKVWLAEQLGRLGLQVEAEVPLPFDQRPDLLTQVGQDKLAVEFQKKSAFR